MRNKAKQLAYGLLYGKGARALSKDLSCSIDEAQNERDTFKRSLPGVVSAFHMTLHPLACLPAGLEVELDATADGSQVLLDQI